MTVINSTDLFHTGSKPMEKYALSIRELLCSHCLSPSHLCQWYLDISFQVWTSQCNSATAGTVQRYFWSICGQRVNNHCWNLNIECSKGYCCPCLKTEHQAHYKFSEALPSWSFWICFTPTGTVNLWGAAVKALVTTANPHRNCNSMEVKK